MTYCAAQELLKEIQTHVETAREKIMIQLDELIGQLVGAAPGLEDSASMLSTERESLARAANLQQDTQKRQAFTLKNFLEQMKNISCARAPCTPHVALSCGDAE
eukprot:COSAG02_NODE_6_length_64796_cov_76.792865_6_plen_104_part_00